MPTKPVPPGEPTSLAPFKELMRTEKVYPAEAYVAAMKRMNELTAKEELTADENRDSAHCARVAAVCLATYRVMPEIFESTLAFPPQAYLRSNGFNSSRSQDAKPLIGSKIPVTDYVRAPRPDDA